MPADQPPNSTPYNDPAETSGALPSAGDGHTTPLPSDAVFLQPAAEAADPDRVGPYRIIRRLGRGGMGVVYLAEKSGDDLNRRVALKLLRRGTDTEEVLSRFRFERKVLAALDHPNIARLYDAGTAEDGRPYFVMEYIQGQTIDEFCDANALSIENRLTLFRKVCDAVHYAHQNLVIHRDIKPQNILVTPAGEPKLLDFGIAKLLNPDLTDAVVHTRPQMQVMTPEYASPEQVRGGVVGTASDVYSLGALLYELLTGRRPLHLETRVREEIVRVVCDESPERPSTAFAREFHQRQPDGTTRRIDAETISKRRSATPDRLRKRLSGDIDLIVLKALEKDPARRYRSAVDLGHDIERHLQGLPVEARRGVADWLYYSRKFIIRHRASVAAAAIIALLLIGGLAATTWQWQRAERATDSANTAHGQTKAALAEAQSARAAAEQSAEEARLATEAEAAARAKAEDLFAALSAASLTFLTDMHIEAEKLAGALPLRAIMIDQAKAIIDALERNSDESDARAINLRALAHTRLGDLLGGARSANTGDLDAAMEQYHNALAMRRHLRKLVGDSDESRADLASVLIRIGDGLRAQADIPSALVRYEEAEKRLSEIPPASRSLPMQRQLATAMLEVAELLQTQGALDDAIAATRRSLAIRREVVQADPDPNHRRSLAVGLTSLSGMLARRGAPGDHAEALDFATEAVAIREQLVTEFPDNARMPRDLAMALDTLAGAHLTMDDAASAIPRLDRAVALMQSVIDAENAAAAGNPDAQTDVRNLEILAPMLREQAKALHLAGRPADARAAIDRSIALGEDLVRADPAMARRRAHRAASLRTLADIQLAAGDAEAARESMTRARDDYRAIAEADPTSTSMIESLAWARLGLAETLIALAEAPDVQPAMRTERLAQARAELAAADTALKALESAGTLSGTGRELLADLQQLRARAEPAGSP